MSVPVMPAGLAGTPLAPQVLQSVQTPSGQTIEVLCQAERFFYEGQSSRYQSENRFTNTSDLLDLDRLIFLELLIFRASSWLGKGQDYDGELLTDRAVAENRRALRENSVLISAVKADLGLTRAARDKADYASVGAYITSLKARAKEFGVHREKQLVKGITLCQQLFSIVGAFDRSDEIERHKIGFPTEADVLDWIREVMRPEFDAVDEHFVNRTQKYWNDL